MFRYLPHEFLVFQCNVAPWESQVDIFEATIAKFGKIDIVVPNAEVAEPMGQYFNLLVGENGRPKCLEMIAFDVDIKGASSHDRISVSLYDEDRWWERYHYVEQGRIWRRA
jgi:NAD(P)-dependent dehydrogenase (short-subunit alcohol dehydrogenase family)